MGILSWGLVVDSLRVPINKLRFKDPIVAGLNAFTMMGMVPLLRSTALDHDPVLVDAPCETCGTRTVFDGRHRWIASVIAGRSDVLAREEQ